MFSSAIVKRGRSSLHKVTSRFYSQGQEPHVFINKHTKVICQGMTGKHVSGITMIAVWEDINF